MRHVFSGLGDQAIFTINCKNITNQGGCKGDLRIRRAESKASRRRVKRATAEHNALIVKEGLAASGRVFTVILFHAPSDADTRDKLTCLCFNATINREAAKILQEGLTNGRKKGRQKKGKTKGKEKGDKKAC
jgi:hypothetical protein